MWSSFEKKQNIFWLVIFVCYELRVHFVVKIYTLDISDLTAVGDLLIVCRQLWGCQIYTFTIITIDVLLLGYKIVNFWNIGLLKYVFVDAIFFNCRFYYCNSLSQNGFNDNDCTNSWWIASSCYHARRWTGLLMLTVIGTIDKPMASFNTLSWTIAYFW